MLNRHASSLGRTTSNGNGTNGHHGPILSSSPQSATYSPQFMYHRSVSTPSPSMPKAIPFTSGYRSRSVFSHNVNWDGNIPPCSAPVAFNRYINVSCNNHNNNTGDNHGGSSPTTSWYARLSSSLKKSVLRRTTSNRESSAQKRRSGGIQRRSVISHSIFIYILVSCLIRGTWGSAPAGELELLYFVDRYIDTQRVPISGIYYN